MRNREMEMSRAEEVNELLEELHSHYLVESHMKGKKDPPPVPNTRVTTIKNRINELTNNGKDVKNIFPTNGGMYPNVFANN